MNNRISEIATECGWEDWTQDDNWINTHASSRGYFILSDLEQFAEKIIRECAAVALREDHEPSECILNHFGIK